MSNEISAIFIKHLPKLDEEKRLALSDGIQDYHVKFKTHRDNAMNYQSDPEYLNEFSTLAVINAEDYWVYSPHFKKSIALTISHLFKTKIMHVSVPNPIPASQDIVFVDNHMNRWIMSVTTHETQPDKLHITMRFPRSNTHTRMVNLIPEKDLSDTNLQATFLVADASEWHNDA